MIGKMCRFYGFTDEHCLKMPARRFFLMFETIEKIRGKELEDECFVSRSSNMSPEGFQSTVNYFSKRGYKEERPEDIVVPKENEPEPEQIKASSNQAKSAVFGMFSGDKRVNRKVLKLKENPRRTH